MCPQDTDAPTFPPFSQSFRTDGWMDKGKPTSPPPLLMWGHKKEIISYKVLYKSRGESEKGLSVYK